ncbi:MAG: DUF4440 domain-containing protein [Bacteroidota bacterium]
MKYSKFLYFSILLITACKSPQPLGKTQQNAPQLIDVVQRHVDGLNKRDFNVLEKIYAEDFAGWAPVVQFEDKASLIEQLKTNYRDSDTQIEIQVLATESGPSLGYVLLHWIAFTPIPDAKAQVLFEKDLLEIWRKDQTGNWQLARMLFFQPEEGFGIE